ncbi:MAG TPA: hypothetical protein VFK05_14670 [Polyangiaceae bacterium]|nr:hypothetical protein [Polyangiaceae bacterium]
MPANTPAAASGPEPGESSTDRRTELRRVYEAALRFAKELHEGAERARRENDPQLSAFFERCARNDEVRAAQAKELLRSRSGPPEEATAAAFAAGDGATDADVSPDSRRRRIGTWPAF